MSNPLISIIVPIYNVEKYLERCIESIIKQTYKNIEIILVNDGSPDHSDSICKRYSDMDNRIIYIEKENGGLSSARNCGIDKATGEYLIFVDSDDYINIDMVKILVSIAEEKKADLVECDYYIDTNQEIKCFKNFKSNLIILNSNQAIERLIKNEGITPTAWNKIYKSCVFKDLRFTNNILHEDEDIIVNVLLKCNTIVISSVPLYYYVLREGSIMTSKVTEKNFDIINIMEKRIATLKQHNFNFFLIELTYARLSNICNELYARILLTDSIIGSSYIDMLKAKRNNTILFVLNSKLPFLKKLKCIIYFVFPKLIYKYK